MAPLVMTLLLLQAAPAVTAPATAAVVPPAAADAPPTPEDTLQGLEQVYSSTCGQTGILYHSYDELCESLRKQIRTYRSKVDLDQAHAAPPRPVVTIEPKR